MTPEQVTLFKEYEDLKIVIKNAEARLEEINPQIIALVPEDKELQAEHGYFTVRKRSVYKYPESIQVAEKALKETKKEAVANGEATVEYVPTLYYTSGTPEDNKKNGDA